MAKEKEINNINRIKAVLADKMITNKWIAEQLGVAPTTVSKWCTNGHPASVGNTGEDSETTGV